MKKALLFLTLVAWSFALFAGETRGKVAVDPSRPQAVEDRNSEAMFTRHFKAELEKGNFVLKSTDVHSLTGIEHSRYDQLYCGLRVWGGEIIVHVRNGEFLSHDGQYFNIPKMDTEPKISIPEAMESLESYFKIKGLSEDPAYTELVIYPLDDKEFRLAYELRIRNAEDKIFNETVLVDAENGTVFLHFPNVIQDELTIGHGEGQHGDHLKFPTTFTNSQYYLMDSAAVRPFVQKTFDAEHSHPGTVYASASADNTWPSDNIVNIHAYIGYAYDFYSITLGLRGVNGNNRALNAFGHVFSKSEGLYDNAFWNPDAHWLYGVGLYFLDPYHTTEDTGAAIDIVGHEYSHAVTHYHAGLKYLNESGALNESFSDVMGTAIEYTFQPEGQGYNLADWYNGEDGNRTFSYSRCRCQSNPNVNSQLKNAGFPQRWWLPDPCHIKQKILPFTHNGYLVDNGGVHLNCTIFPHAFYLLAHGGTNKISGIRVEGIGLSKALSIFYDAWVHHMVSTTNFLGAANALLKSAFEIYGGSSAEYAQTVNAVRAIGYTVK